MLSKAVATALTARTPKVLGVDPRCRRLLLIDLFELRNLLDLARERGTTIPSVLEAWVGSTIPDLSLRNWLTTDGPGLPSDETKPEWFTFVCHRLEPHPSRMPAAGKVAWMRRARRQGSHVRSGLAEAFPRRVLVERRRRRTSSST